MVTTVLTINTHTHTHMVTTVLTHTRTHTHTTATHSSIPLSKPFSATMTLACSMILEQSICNKTKHISTEVTNNVALTYTALTKGLTHASLTQHYTRFNHTHLTKTTPIPLYPRTHSTAASHLLYTHSTPTPTPLLPHTYYTSTPLLPHTYYTPTPLQPHPLHCSPTHSTPTPL